MGTQSNSFDSDYIAYLPSNLRGRVVDLDRELYGQYLSFFYDFIMAEKNFSSHTIRAYVVDTFEFLDYLSKEGKTIFEVDALFVRGYFGFRTGALFPKGRKTPNPQLVAGEGTHRKLSPRTQARKLATLRSFFRLLHHRDKIKENPLTSIPTPRFFRSLPGYIRGDDLVKILEDEPLHHESHVIDPYVETALSIRDRSIYEMLYSTGMRISELMSIKVDEVLHLPSQIKITGKGGRERFVFFGPDCLEALHKYLEIRDSLHPTDEALFLNHRGSAMNDRGVRYRLSRLKHSHELSKHVHPHKFRHTFATDLLNEGADIRSVQDLLGHVSISSTQVYTSVSKERLKQIHRNCHPHAKTGEASSNE